MKRQAIRETAAHSKKVVTAMRKQMLSDAPAVLSHGVERDEHGDTVAFCDYRATCKARMIGADYALILAVDYSRDCLDGLRVGTFEGLAIGPDHGAGDVYAVFTNGRKVPFLREERTPVTDPNERTARIAEYTLLQKENAADVTETAPAISGGWKHGKLILKAVPNGKKPGVFTFKRRTYTVPSGKAWTCVCSLIEAGGFNSHGVEMDSPSAMFKRQHRAFFTERMASDATGWWYIKTV
jgi:hypothetical protein